MIGGLLLICWRLLELLTLIPILGMLAYFVHQFVSANQLTPIYILVLFIVSILAAAWALATMVKRESVRHNAFFVAFVDLCFMGALIAGVYELRDIARQNCVTTSGGLSSSTGDYSITIGYSPFDVNANRECSMLKACFALGIMNCVFFPVTALIAVLMRRPAEVVVEEKYRRRSHDSRRGHSTHSAHRRRSSRDSRRQYYV